MTNPFLSRMCALMVLLTALLYWGDLEAKPLKVIATIPPLASIAQDLLGQEAEVSILLGPGVSPHTSSLKPSERRSLQKADLILWVGPELETFLAPLLQKESIRALSMMRVPNLTLYDNVSSCPQHQKEPSCHHHNRPDPHVWLSVPNMIRFADALKEHLTAAHPHLSSTLEARSETLFHRLRKLDSDLKKILEGVTIPFFVTHDSLQYFEKQYGLKRSFFLSLEGDGGVSLKHLQTLRKVIQEKGVSCLFADSFYDPERLKKFSNKLGLSYATLDILGYDEDGLPVAYTTIMYNLGQTLSKCLKRKNKS